MKVYIAGSSDELERAARWKQRLLKAGVEVISTWVESVQKHNGVSNPLSATWADRYDLGKQCIKELFEADIMWMLVPTKGHGRGTYFELGYATAHRIVTIASGPTKQSIFCAQGVEYPDDEIAFNVIVATAARESNES